MWFAYASTFNSNVEESFDSVMLIYAGDEHGEQECDAFMSTSVGQTCNRFSWRHNCWAIAWFEGGRGCLWNSSLLPCLPVPMHSWNDQQGGCLVLRGQVWRYKERFSGTRGGLAILWSILGLRVWVGGDTFFANIFFWKSQTTQNMPKF